MTNHIKKWRPPQEYEEIDLVDYIRTIKKHLPAIGGIMVGIALLTGVVSVLATDSANYTSEVVIEIGRFQGNPIETVEEVTDLITRSYENISIQKGKRSNEIILKSEGASREAPQKTLQNTINGLIEHHRIVRETKIKSNDRQVAFLQQRIKQNEDLLNRYEQKFSQLSPQAQGIALQTYAASYSAIFERINALQTNLSELELKNPDYTETKVRDAPSIPHTGKLNASKKILIGVLLGLIIGAIVGIFWAFAKEWSDKNKKLLK